MQSSKSISRKKESNEEEDEPKLLGSSKEEEVEKGSDLITIKENLDPNFLLKTHLMLISFSTEVSFFKELIFFDVSNFSVLN